MSYEGDNEMTRLPTSPADIKPEVFLKRHFRQHGYARVSNKKRKKELGQNYKKGYEVRLVATTRTELRQIRQWLRQAGFKAGKPFQKGTRIVQPVYGKATVEWFTGKKIK